MPATAIFCCRCKKDISAEKRVKDPRGNLWCEPCYKAAVAQKQQKQQQQQQKTAAPPPPPRPAQRPQATPPARMPANTPARPPAGPAIRQPAAPPPAAPAAGPKPIPEFCPACGAPTLKGRRICFKCNRDLTKMDKLLALRAEHAKVSTEEKLGSAIGKIIKVSFILFLVAACGFMGYGAWMMFHPGKPFDDYPTTRADAVKQILADIQEGSDKSYEAAFKLITLHVRTTANAHQDLVYKMVYQRMHDDFLKLYGPNWLAKAKIEKENPENNEEIVPYSVTIGDDVYHVLTQAQIAGGQVAKFEDTMLHGEQEFPENGQRHFGIYEIFEYTVRQKDKDENKGSTHLHLKALDDAQNNAADDNPNSNTPKPDSNAPPAP